MADAQEDISASSQNWETPAILTTIALHITEPKDLLNFSRVSKAWQHAAADKQVWSGVLARSFGRCAWCTNGAVESPIDTYKRLALLTSASSLTGWCEDHVTSRGRPYHMVVHQLKYHLSSSSIVYQRVAEGQVEWDYAQPTPRTHIKLVCCEVTREVWDKGGRTCVAFTRQAGHKLPLYSRRAKLLEYAKLPGSGPVDIPNNYFAFQVGPVLLGGFMPPQTALPMMNLSRHDQMLGTFVLWPSHLQPSHKQGTCSCTICSDGASEAAAAASESNAVAAAPDCSRLRWQGVHVGAQLTGTVLANFHVHDMNTGLRRGHAMLGAVQVVVLSAAPSPPGALHTDRAFYSRQMDDKGHGQAAVRLQLLLHIPSREWAVDAQGCPQAPEYESAYTAPITCMATVDMTMDGRLHAVKLPPLATPPQPPLDACWVPGERNITSDAAMLASGKPHITASAAAWEHAHSALTSRTPMSHGMLGAPPGIIAGMPAGPMSDVANIHARIMLAAAIELADNATPFPDLVDRWPAELHGQVAGGLLTGVMTHPVVGSAVLCVSEAGLTALCPQWKH